MASRSSVISEFALNIHGFPAVASNVKKWIWLCMGFTSQSCSPNNSSSCGRVKEDVGEVVADYVPTRIPKTC